MFYLNGFSALFMFIYLALNPFSSELSQSIQFCIAHPLLLRDILIFAVCGAAGQCFVFSVLHEFGSLVLVTITVTRKMFSILISVVYFKHTLSLGQWASVALVFVALSLESLEKVLFSSSNSKVETEIKTSNSKVNTGVETDRKTRSKTNKRD